MALQGNPFLGKLKIPAPDLSRIPETPFESKPDKPSEPFQSSTDPSVEKPKAKTDRVQTGSEIGFNRVQQQDRKFTPTLLNPFEPVLDRVQTGSVTGSNSPSRLPAYGELAVLRYFADRERSPGEVISTRRREIAVSTAQTLNGVKTALRRLRETRLIELCDFTRGPNRGITSYQLTARARELLGSKSVIDKLGFKRVQTGSVTGSNGFFSSSIRESDQNFKTTTTNEPELFENTGVQLAPEWQTVDVSPLSEIGFTTTHLIQIIRQGKLRPAEVQDSIHFFAFDLKQNGKGKEIKGLPVNFFMGILRKGLPYAPPENYESLEQTARRIYLQGKRRIEEQRLTDERELRDLEFTEWRRGLTREQIAGIVPDVVRAISPAREASLKAHFDEQVWPLRSAAIPGVLETESQQIRTGITKSFEEAQT